MFKDKEKQKEAVREAAKRHRVLLRGITGGEKVIPETVKEVIPDRIAFIRKELNNPGLVDGIERAGKLMNDREQRYERAYRYHLWRQGRRVPEIDREAATRICQALDREVRGLDGRHENLGTMVRWGISGPTVLEVGEMLEDAIK